jgi:hypothetical protein
MHQLEEAFRSRMGHLLTQGSTILNRTDQTIVAAWGIKTWSLLIPAVRHMQKGFRLNVPIAHYRWIMQHRTPPPRIQMWIGGVDALPAELISLVNVLRVEDGPNSQRGVAGIFSIGRLLFFIYGPTTVESLKLGIDGNLAGRLIPIWAVEEETVIWPPGRLFSAAELDALYPNGGVIHASSSS